MRARLLASPLTRWGLALVALLVLAALAAPLLTAHDPERPLDPVAGRHLPPGSQRYLVVRQDGAWLLAERVDRSAGGLELESSGRRFTLPLTEVADPAPGRPARRLTFPLGTDRFGRDVWARLLYGARTSLTIGLLAAALSFTLGTAAGALAAGAGGWIDGAVMRLVDALLTFPRLFLLVALAALFEAGQWLIILVLGSTGWMAASRLTRGRILSLREQEFALAARASGLGPVRVLWRHLLPNALGPVLVDTTLRVGNLILAEAALSFLGLGVQPPAPSWGSMIADGTDALTEAWWVSAFPGSALALTVIAFNLLGDGLRDALDPRGQPARALAAQEPPSGIEE